WTHFEIAGSGSKRQEICIGQREGCDVAKAKGIMSGGLAAFVGPASPAFLSNDVLRRSIPGTSRGGDTSLSLRSCLTC
ncbi:MAG: hypothetical protein ABI837_18775, partial [Acidobacteriota bacterium]